MSTKKSKMNKIDLQNLKPDEKLKYEIATELGLIDKVMNSGWKSLSAKETGRIGGIMTKRKKQMEGINKSE
ncbi:MAG: Small, acid-soluble spore protein, alpha/beta type [Lachnoclostridium sp.]|jgi:hypothetical protein